ncbi:hypothetical protein AALB_3286 [Agarivorans albus MKT 106]|uniref:Uncharacterized protein n=1 Tax=Agarivorans albus MKT 106 TaxID=1331007 RepID=R9PTY0_AGAAL|nr:hypothetical protein AALB_3286 [Agarivorans albus MKT 106]
MCSYSLRLGALKYTVELANTAIGLGKAAVAFGVFGGIYRSN